MFLYFQFSIRRTMQPCRPSVVNKKALQVGVWNLEAAMPQCVLHIATAMRCPTRLRARVERITTKPLSSTKLCTDTCHPFLQWNSQHPTQDADTTPHTTIFEKLVEWSMWFLRWIMYVGNQVYGGVHLSFRRGYMSVV